ncbi:hypothetical protein Pelo_18110 [Pelomyxa schiedti]|nr:hypothetical protein Pelo_18110 [Pelomyxa schiedti]
MRNTDTTSARMVTIIPARPITPKFPAKRSTNHAYEYITAPGNFKRLRGRNELSRREIVKSFRRLFTHNSTADPERR